MIRTNRSGSRSAFSLIFGVTGGHLPDIGFVLGVAHVVCVFDEFFGPAIDLISLVHFRRIDTTKLTNMAVCAKPSHHGQHLQFLPLPECPPCHLHIVQPKQTRRA